MEVGPLSRLIVAYASGRTDVQELVKDTLGKLNVPVGALFSTLGRTAARGLDAALAMIWLKEFYQRSDGAGQDQRSLHVQRREVGTEDLAGRMRKASD